MNINEKKLILKAQKKDWQSFEGIVKKYQDKIYSISLTLTGNRLEAEELAQRAFIKLWKKIGKFEFRSAFSTWLYRLVHNIFYDYVRSEKRKRNIEVPLEKFHSLADKEADIYSKLEEKELKEILYRTINRIPEKLRMVVIYYDIEGMSYKEIAGIIRKPIGTVKSRLNRGRSILRNELGNILGAANV
ncbi:RNA polymerase sigma factor [Elusimicrobiota bacterium]